MITFGGEMLSGKSDVCGAKKSMRGGGIRIDVSCINSRGLDSRWARPIKIFATTGGLYKLDSIIISHVISVFGNYRLMSKTY